jgi:hypothetical protein
MTPKEEKELLLRVVTKLAGQQLEKGGSIAFGATLGSKRDVQLLMPKRAETYETRRDDRRIGCILGPNITPSGRYRSVQNGVFLR